MSDKKVLEEVHIYKLDAGYTVRAKFEAGTGRDEVIAAETPERLLEILARILGTEDAEEVAKQSKAGIEAIKNLNQFLQSYFLNKDV